MQEFNIPKVISLGGITVTTIEGKKLKDKSMIGEACYAEQTITIDFTVAHNDCTLQTWWHEVIHWILFVMNKDDLRNNEEFVDVFAHLLYQAIKSGGFDVQTNKVQIGV